MKEKVTVLIQGPLNLTSLNNVENYKQFCSKIVISHWDEDLDTDNVELINKYSELKKDKDVVIVSNPLVDLTAEEIQEEKVGVLFGSTFYWAIESTYFGFLECKTEYVIKTRSDEYFTDLSEIIGRAMFYEGKKLVCGSIFVRSYYKTPMHIGDHIFALKTEDAIDMYQDLYDMYNKQKPLERWATQGPLSAEQIVGFAFLKHALKFEHMNFVLHLKANTIESIKALKAIYNSTYVISVRSELGDYEVSHAHAKQKWNSATNKFSNRHNIDSHKHFIAMAKRENMLIETIERLPK